MRQAAVRALILSRDHQVLHVGDHLPVAEGPWPERPLLMLAQYAAAALGVELPAP